MCLRRLYPDCTLTSDAVWLSERALIFVWDEACQGAASCRAEESYQGFGGVRSRMMRQG